MVAGERGWRTGGGLLAGVARRPRVPGCLVLVAWLGEIALFLTAAIYGFNPSDYLRPFFAFLALLVLAILFFGLVFAALFGRR